MAREYRQAAAIREPPKITFRLNRQIIKHQRTI
jgi:hypothetical protein